MTNIFRSIGNAFKAGWNNGNISKGLKAAGMTAMTGALVGAAIDDMKRSRSCCCGGSVFNGYLGGGFCSGNVPYGVQGMSIGFDPYLMQNPMDILGYSNMGYTNNYCSNFGMLNSYMNGGYGANLGMFKNTNYLNPSSYPILQMTNFGTFSAQSPTTLQQQFVTQNQYAGDISTSQDKTKGEKLDSELNGLRSNGTAVAGKSAQLVNYTDSSDEAKSKQEYKEQISELGKSYVATMAKDGKVTVTEFVEAKLKDLPANATEQQKADVRLDAINAFATLDQNGDGKFDWKEASAMMRTFDRNSNNIVDGKIQSEDFERHSDNLVAADEGSIQLRRMLIDDYKTLFGND